MNTKMFLVFGLVMGLCAVVTQAQTEFTNALGDHDFNNAANWSNGLPGANAGGNATINDAAEVDDRMAVLTSNYLRVNGVFSLTLGRETTGHLVIPTGRKLDLGNDVFVGQGVGGMGRLDLWGTLQVSGGGVDLFIGDGTGQGTVTVYDGGFLDARKATEILTGTLTIYPHAVSQLAKDEYVVDAGTLRFITDGPTVSTILGRTLALELGPASTLEVILTGTFDIGDQWTLFEGVSTIGGVAGAPGGVFGHVVCPQGDLEVTYTPQSSAGAGDGTVVVTLVGATALPVRPSTFENIPVTTDLAWKPGSISPVAAYDVYFSTDPNLPPESKIVDRALVTSVDPTPGADLAYETTYYWRVDVYEPNEPNPVRHEGPLWSFTTQPPVPQIAVHPEPLQIVAAGQTATVRVEALNGEFYQWFKQGQTEPLANGGDISGADTDTLQIANLDREDEGFYYCVVSNSLSSETATSNPGRIMTQRLIGWWTLDETLVDAVDGWEGHFMDPATGQEQDPVYRPVVNDANELIGQAVAFTGDGRHIRIDDSADPDYFNFYALGMTVSCWIKTDVAQPGATMVAKQRPNAFDGWALMNPDVPQYTIRRTTDPMVEGPEALTDGQWHMVTGRYDGRFLTLYVDATEVDVSLENVEPLVLPGDPLVIGADNADGGGSFTGLIDDVRLWNYAIDPLEIAQLYVDRTGKPACMSQPQYDLDGDCVVDLADIHMFVEQWLVSNRVDPD